MEKLRKLFGEYSMTWPKVILFAVVTAVYTALINEVRFLRGTSFQDIAINFECWILFAVFIIVNSRKWWEAALKCFVFFLISQPLIFLIEVPFEPAGWAVFDYYRRWFNLTVLTLPGAAVAFLLKKKNFLSVAVLSVATGFLAYDCIYYLRSVIYSFPHHLLSAVFCLALAVFFAFVLFDEKKHRVAALIVICIVLAVTPFFLFRGTKTEFYLPAGTWDYTLEEKIVSVSVSDDGRVCLRSRRDGDTLLYLTGEDGTVRTYDVSVKGGSVWVSSYDE